MSGWRPLWTDCVVTVCTARSPTWPSCKRSGAGRFPWSCVSTTQEPLRLAWRGFAAGDAKPSRIRWRGGRREVTVRWNVLQLYVGRERVPAGPWRVARGSARPRSLGRRPDGWTHGSSCFSKLQAARRVPESLYTVQLYSNSYSCTVGGTLLPRLLGTLLTGSLNIALVV